ncbi:hypothetical protein MKW92_034819 [Papaver armeniacum]|nr:hypothetical protein MKW92_034819 [Papaver armeniacum]
MPGYFDLVISDVHMPEMSGFQLLQCILQEFATLPVFLMSGDDDREMVRKGIENGAAFYLTKPLTYSDIEKLWQHVFTKNMQTKNMRKTESRGQNSLQHNKQKITNDQNQKIGNICGSQYSFPSFQEESRDSSFNAQSLLLPANNNQRLATPAHQTWLAHNTSIENEQSMNPQNIATISHSNTTISGSGFISDPNFNIGGTSSKVNDQNQKIGNIGGTQYSFSSFQEESRDSRFQGFNAQPLLLPANNNQRLATPAHQTWLAHNTSIENEQSVNPQNIATISHSNTTISGNEFISDPNFNISEHLVGGDTDDPQNTTISHCNTTISGNEFMSDPNFNISEYLVDGDTDDQQNIATTSHCNTTISGNEFMSVLNFNISEYLVDGDTDDSDII